MHTRQLTAAVMDERCEVDEADCGDAVTRGDAGRWRCGVCPGVCGVCPALDEL